MQATLTTSAVSSLLGVPAPCKPHASAGDVIRLVTRMGYRVTGWRYNPDGFPARYAHSDFGLGRVAWDGPAIERTRWVAMRTRGGVRLVDEGDGWVDRRGWGRFRVTDVIDVGRAKP